MTAQLALLDYATLDPETRIVVQQRTGEIKALVRRSAQDIIDIGQKLIEVKAKLHHGQYGAWLQGEFDWSEQTANRFMQVAARFGQIPQIEGFAPSALYLLAAPSTPEEARREALARAGQGEQITYSGARQIVEEHKPARPVPPVPVPAPPPPQPDPANHIDPEQWANGLARAVPTPQPPARAFPGPAVTPRAPVIPTVMLLPGNRILIEIATRNGPASCELAPAEAGLFMDRLAEVLERTGARRVDVMGEIEEALAAKEMPIL